jgi:hypothetical protein
MTGRTCRLAYRGDRGQDMAIDVHALIALGQLTVAITRGVAPAAACLNRQAASNESAGVAPDSRIAGNARALRREDGSFRDG